MSKVVIQGDTNGTGVFTLASPNSNTDRTLTLPDEAGTVLTSASNVAQKGVPAFRAYMSTAQTISGSTFTKLNFNAELFDTNSNYDTALYRFTPTVAGYYQVAANTYFTATAQVYIYKNGSVDLTGVYGNFTGHFIAGLVYMNGSTDYLEAYYYGTGVTTSNNSAFANQFSGALVRAD